MSELAIREFEAIAAYLAATGTPHRVTSTTGGVHSPGSYHYKGCAIDAAGIKPSWNSPALLAIFAAFGPVESQLAELIYSGAPYGVKDGKRVARYAIPAHWNHVHVAVRPGVFLSAPKPPAPKENVVAVNAPPVAVLTHPAWGSGYAVVMADGGVATFGGAPFFGSLGGVQLAAPIVAAAVTPSGQGYKLLGRDGGDFNFGDAVGAGRVEYSGS